MACITHTCTDKTCDQPPVINNDPEVITCPKCRSNMSRDIDEVLEEVPNDNS